jgi:hypothetical protein
VINPRARLMPNYVLFCSKDNSSHLMISGVSQFQKKLLFNYGILENKKNFYYVEEVKNNRRQETLSKEDRRQQKAPGAETPDLSMQKRINTSQTVSISGERSQRRP